jgi:SAM-dependent methyltransferase
MSNPTDRVLQRIDDYYTNKLREHGATPRGVDWNSPEAQQIRFDQLLRLLPTDSNESVLDYGCGYGAFVEHLRQRFPAMAYSGYDVSQAMIEQARALHPELTACFTAERAALKDSDFVVASGIFSVKMDLTPASWERYIFESLDHMWSLTQCGMAFNLLTIYSDADKMRDTLYYADPHSFFDYCRRRFSGNLALLHDYGLYEFTMLVRR